MFLIELEGKVWVSFPWCWVSGVKKVDCDLGSAVFSQAGKGISSAVPLPCGFVIYWGPGCLKICQALGHQDVWFYGAAQAKDILESLSQDSEFISKLVGGSSFKEKFAHYFCFFGGCPHNTFYSFLSWNQELCFFRSFFFSHKYVDHNYDLSYESFLEVFLLWQYLCQ